MNKIITKNNRLLFLLIVILFSLIRGNSSIVAYANEEDKQNSETESITGFTYSLSFPDNQLEENVGYYKLKMAPGQKQTIKITLSNPGSEKVTVGIGINSAKTNQNGVIEYGDSTIKNDASLKFDFKDIVKAPKSVDLAPGESKELETEIEMPTTAYDGVIAGGIQLMKENQNSNVTNSSGSQILNQYAYVIAVLLQESNVKLEPDLKLNKVYADQINYRNAVFIDFSNIMATYLNNVTVEAQVMKKGSDTVLYERKQSAMRMAPNSFMAFPVNMNGEEMVSGDYVAKVLVTSADQKWEWTEDFNISKKEADKFNERDVGLVQEKGLDWQLIAMLVGASLLMIGLFFTILTFMRKKKEKKELARRKAKMQAKKKASKKN
ncbi:DUF916 and DUF3324 domain-containing protein [Enterococcus rivorum]|uniref:Uncharacterized protein n=1 Tax=Enterococcus rivorum TaxID=762845 RepID=A0A1E5KXI0_9ENTE|nr:DUF916 and DUF3324 domain-containing protein [Enterococcus rivorum]MBP2099892.1 cell division protein FtsB [Enterococcus rivorum]OEH82572.1 hypothetical protein BCR26_13050 [Enterococcus rivorum]